VARTTVDRDVLGAVPDDGEELAGRDASGGLLCVLDRFVVGH
jgi:hypothetical protein